MKLTAWITLTLLTIGPLSGADSEAIQTVGSPIDLTQSGVYYMAPKWSPDGITIAATGASYNGIYLIDFPSTTIRQLSDAPSVGYGMAWSHDGKGIAARMVKMENKRRYHAVAIFDVATGEHSLISPFETTLSGTPKWSINNGFIYMTSTDKFKSFPATLSALGKNNAPSQDHIYYLKHGQMMRRAVATQTEKPAFMVSGKILNHALSPDGTKMVYEVMGGSIWVSDIEGTNSVDLGPGDNPVWNPTGDKVAFAVTTDDGHTLLTADIIVVNADGTGRVNMTNTPDILEINPAWSPDGQWIAYGTVNKGQIFVQEVR